jgi:antitoxin YefM
MLTISILDFRENIKIYLNKVSKNFETLMIDGGENNSVVIMPLKAYNSLLATAHELSSKNNEKRLDSAIKKIER